METEKRIGDFRVNRKVAWGIFFHNPCTTRPSIRKAAFCGILANFVHSIGVECRSPPPEPFHAVQEPGQRHWVLKSEPVVCDGLGPHLTLLLVQAAMALDHYLLDRAWEARLAGSDSSEILHGHPSKQAL